MLAVRLRNLPQSVRTLGLITDLRNTLTEFQSGVLWDSLWVFISQLHIQKWENGKSKLKNTSAEKVKKAVTTSHVRSTNRSLNPMKTKKEFLMHNLLQDVKRSM